MTRSKASGGENPLPGRLPVTRPLAFVCVADFVLARSILRGLIGYNCGMAESTEVASSEPQTTRKFIEERVAERARRNTAEQVQDTCSFARAERLLGREYHGRFLIELLQNAADAWREGRPVGARSRVRIVLGDGPCLLVANQGRPFPEICGYRISRPDRAFDQGTG